MQPQPMLRDGTPAVGDDDRFARGGLGDDGGGVLFEGPDPHLGHVLHCSSMCCARLCGGGFA